MRGAGFIMGLALLSLSFACSSPNSPENNTSLDVAFQYGLYDNFESPSLSSTLWSGTAEITYEDGSHVARLVQEGVGKKQIVMNWPRIISAAEFQEWSTRIKLESGSSAQDFVSGFEYCGREKDLGWCAGMGLHVRGNSCQVFASWKNPAAGENFYESYIEVETDRWYTLKIDMRARDDSKVAIRYYLDGRLIASTVTADSCRELQSRVTQPQRKLGIEIFFDPSQQAVCLFDDVFGVYGDTGTDT
jgi:hypothetical protein